MQKKVLMVIQALIMTAGWPASQAGTAKTIQGATPARHKQVMIYHEPDRFAGWPANDGIWIWDNEILVGLVVGYHKEKSGHTIDNDQPKRHLFARSLDGGETWVREDAYDSGLKGAESESSEVAGRLFVPATDCPGGIDFTHPDFALVVRRLNNNVGPSIFYYSYTRGRSWAGPFRLPNMGTPGVAGRTDYIVNGRHDCMLFLTAAKENGKEGRPFCARTTDGGKSWQFMSYIALEPPGFSIMPGSVRLSPLEILVLARERERNNAWIAAYLSRDNGQSWSPLERPVANVGGNGNPPALIRLKDGRLCLAYGVRSEPFRITARLSADQGRNWSEEIVLRDGGGTLDLGYCRSVQRPDGKVVTIYYFNDPKVGKERHISATIWDPGR